MKPELLIRVVAGILDQWHKGNIQADETLDMISAVINCLYES